MKRLTVLLALLCLILLLPGCGGSRDADAPAFYYLYEEPTFGTNGSIIGSEVRLDDSEAKDLAYLLALYLSGPISDELRSPFPPNTQIEDLHQSGSILYLTMEGSFSQLSGTGLTKAYACVALTIFDNTDAQLMYLTIEDPAADMVRTTELTRDSLVLQDTSTGAP